MNESSTTAAKNPGVEIEIGGRKRKLLVDLNAMIEFEERTGEDFAQALASVKSNAKQLRILLYCAALNESPDLTLKEVGSWVHLGNMEEISNALTAAKKNCLDIEDKKENPIEGQPPMEAEVAAATGS